MDRELLAKADPHIRQEWDKQRDLNGVLETALIQAIAAYRSGRPPEALPGRAPAADAAELEWIDYFVGEGAKVFHEQLQTTIGGEDG